MERDEVVTGGLGAPGDERDDPRSNGRKRDAGYAPPTEVIAMPW